MAVKIRNLVYTCPVDHLGTSVFVKGWISYEAPKQSIILVHDLGESAEVFDLLATRLVNAGFNVYSFDQRGHGQSGQRLGYIPSFTQLSLDLLQVAAWVKHQDGGKKPLIVGQGMGGLVTLLFTRNYSKYSSGAILASPLVSTLKPVTSFQRFVVKTLAEFFPTLILPSFLCPVFTSGRKKLGKPIALVGALLAHELLMASSQAKKLLQRQDVPTLIAYSIDDPVCRYEPLRKFIQKQNNKNVFSFEAIEGSTHRLLSEGDEETDNKVFQMILSWLEPVSAS